MRAPKVAGFLAAAALLTAVDASLAAQPAAPLARPEGWLVKSFSELKSAPPPAVARGELDEMKAMMAKRTAADVERIHWWSVGGPVYRWNEIAIEELLDNFVTLPLAARHLALLHAAMDDAVTAAWHDKQRFRRPRPSKADASIKTAVAVPASPSSYPSDFAAAAAAAAEVLGYLFPSRASAFAARAEEAMRARILAGAEFPSDVAAGRALGQGIGALAVARGKADGSDAKWTGRVPEGPGIWKGTSPIAPLAGTWQPWVLARQDELRPPAPPAFDSEEVKRDQAELKAYQRTPKSNHRAVYWEVYGGARAHALWNEIARLKLLEDGTLDAPTAARMLAALNIAFLDSAIACWDAKYAYWFIRPSQLDPELKPVFPPPNHPSYPAAHGCLSTAAATVLARLFPRDADRLLAHGKEAAEARVWAGIHYRFDIDVGQAIGRKTAEKVLARGFKNPAQ